MFTCAKRAHVQQWHMCAFQFQTGVIRSVRGAMNCATTSQEDKGFNSKLVRLKADTRTCAAVVHHGAKCKRRFNSKLVRLEVLI